MVELVIRRRVPVKLDLKLSVSGMARALRAQTYQRPPYSSPYFSIIRHDPFPAKVVRYLVICSVRGQFGS